MIDIELLNAIRLVVREEVSASENRMTAKIEEAVSASENRMTAKIEEAVNASENRMTAKIEEAVNASENRMTAKIEEAVNASENRMMAYFEGEVMKRFDYLAEGQRMLVEKFSQIDSMAKDIDELKGALVATNALIAQHENRIIRLEMKIG